MKIRRAFLTVTVLQALLAHYALQAGDKELLRLWSAPGVSVRDRAAAVNRSFTNGTPITEVIAVLGTNFATSQGAYSALWMGPGPGPEPGQTLGMSYSFGDDEVRIWIKDANKPDPPDPLTGKFTSAIAITANWWNTATNQAGTDSSRPFFFTNQVAFTNGQFVLSAVQSGDAQSKTSVQALIGSPIVFIGSAAPPGGSANLMVWSNVLVEVEIRPARDVRPHSVFWTAEVSGTLRSVDFEKRAIRIRAKPEDWKPRDLY